MSKIDIFMIRLMGKPQQGWINIGTNNISKLDFLYKLTNAKAALKSITLFPGETKYLFLQRSSKEFNLSFEKLNLHFSKYSPFEDGFFVPQTYSFPYNITEEQFIYTIYKYSYKQHNKIAKRIFGNINKKKWLNYMIIASIIEKEAGDKEEMKLISSVIYNRLKKNMRLQMDGTLNYGKYSGERIRPHRIKNDKSKFNTYKYRGLPPHPVSSVSIDAIKAAISPANTKYLYFVKIGDKKHKFSKTYKEHLRFIRKK